MSDMIRSTAPTSPTSPGEVHAYAIDSFNHFSYQFLTALAEKYTGTTFGDAFRDKQLQYDLAITHNHNKNAAMKKKEELVSTFYKQMHSHFAEIQSGDISKLRDVEFVQNLGVAKVLDLNDDDTNEAVRDFLKQMVESCILWSVYSKIPAGLLTTIGTAAQTLQDNGGAPDQMDMATISQSMFNNINTNDIQQFATNMLQNQDAFQDLCALASNSLSQMQMPKAA